MLYNIGLNVLSDLTGWEIFAFQSSPNLLTFEMLLIETDFDIGRVYGFVYLII